jgi:hypothetical protein
MSTIRSTELLLYSAASDVALLRWPEQRDEREQLDQLGLPRLLVVGPEATPPPIKDCIEDWIRLPADDTDIQQRLAALHNRSQRHPAAPIVTPWGEISFRGSSVFLSPRELALAAILANEFRIAVSECNLLEQAWPDGEGTSNAVHVHMSRLRKRISTLGLTVRTVRGYGYLMSASTKGGR